MSDLPLMTHNTLFLKRTGNGPSFLSLLLMVLLLTFLLYDVILSGWLWLSPWYNRNGWLGVKHQVTSDCDWKSRKGLVCEVWQYTLFITSPWQRIILMYEPVYQIRSNKSEIQTHNRIKRTLFIRTKHNTRIFWVIPFIRLQIVERWKTMKNETEPTWLYLIDLCCFRDPLGCIWLTYVVFVSSVRKNVGRTIKQERNISVL